MRGNGFFSFLFEWPDKADDALMATVGGNGYSSMSMKTLKAHLSLSGFSRLSLNGWRKSWKFEKTFACVSELFRAVFLFRRNPGTVGAQTNSTSSWCSMMMTMMTRVMDGEMER